MSHYSALLRPHHGKNTNSINNPLSLNNENDENSTTQGLIFKNMSKTQHASIISNSTKGTMRGILGEVGNMTLVNKSIISKSKFIHKHSKHSLGTIPESQSTDGIIPSMPLSLPSSTSSLVTTTKTVINQTEEIIFETNSDLSTEIPAEFDCDSGDLNNITTASEFVVDICKYWRELEQRTPIRQNFLLFRREGSASPQNRAVLIDWLYQVHDRFKLLTDTFHMTIHLLDRYLQVVDVSKHELQLIGSTALLLACKYEEMAIPGMNDFVYVSDNAFSKEDMKEMERRIITTLSFDLGRPLSINYLRRYSKISKVTDIEHTLGKYLLDLTLLDHSFSHMLPSYISACAAFLSRYLFAFKRITSSASIPSLIETLWPNKFMLYHTGYTYEQLNHGIELLGQLLIGQETTKLRSVQRKFCQSNFFSVALNNCCKSVFVKSALSYLSM